MCYNVGAATELTRLPVTSFVYWLNEVQASAEYLKIQIISLTSMQTNPFRYLWKVLGGIKKKRDFISEARKKNELFSGEYEAWEKCPEVFL